MTLRDYYFGRRVRLRSPLRPDEIAQRIKDDTKVDWWWKPLRTGPVGGVRWSRLKVRYASSPFEYNAKPILVGPIERTATGTVMCLVYRGRTWSRIFYVFWYLFLTLLLKNRRPARFGKWMDKLLPPLPSLQEQADDHLDANLDMIELHARDFEDEAPNSRTRVEE